VLLFALSAMQAWGPAHAQGLLLDELLPPPATQAPGVTPFQAWQRRCAPNGEENKGSEARAGGDPGCALVYAGHPDQPDTMIGTDSPVRSLSILPQGPGQAPLMVIRSRLGLLLPEGMALSIDGGRPQRLAFRACYAQPEMTGCLLPVRVAGRFARDMKRGLILTLEARTPEGRRLTQTVSLRGITAGLAALAAHKP